MTSKKVLLKVFVGSVFCGVLMSLTTGVIENPPEASIIGSKYYGYPLVWRVTMTLQPDNFRFADLAIDILFWITISFLALIVLKKVAASSSKAKSSSNSDNPAANVDSPA